MEMNDERRESSSVGVSTRGDGAAGVQSGGAACAQAVDERGVGKAGAQVVDERGVDEADVRGDGEAGSHMGKTASRMQESPAFRVILASGSPRRRELLEKAGVTFTVQVSEVDESLEPDLLADPPEAAKKLAERKAGAVVQELLADENARGMMIVIGADTMVVKGGQIFGKPRNLSHAKHMLRELSGVTHEVVTAVSVWMVAVSAEGEVSLGFRTFADTSRVTFHELSDEQIADYLRKGESFDKAGAYAVQGAGASLVKQVEGALDTVIGLPVERLLREFPDLAPQGA